MKSGGKIIRLLTMTNKYIIASVTVENLTDYFHISIEAHPGDTFSTILLNLVFDSEIKKNCHIKKCC
jgi:hypothetical protein